MGNLVDVPKAMLAAEGTVRKRTDWDIGMCRGWEAPGGHHIIAGAQELQCLPITLPGLGLPGDKNEPIRAARSFREGGGKVERGRRYQLAVLHDGGDAAGPKTPESVRAHRASAREGARRALIHAL